MSESSDLAIALGIVFMLRIFLGLLAFLLVAAVVRFLIERIDARRPTPRTRIHGVDVARCERAGSQGENMRRIRTGVGR